MGKGIRVFCVIRKRKRRIRNLQVDSAGKKLEGKKKKMFLAENSRLSENAGLILLNLFFYLLIFVLIVIRNFILTIFFLFLFSCFSESWK